VISDKRARAILIYSATACGMPSALPACSCCTLLLAFCARGRLTSKGRRILALAWPLVFNIIALVEPPRFSIDVLAYVARITEKGNQYLQPVSVVAGTPLGAHLSAHGWSPQDPVPVSPYGPLWTAVEAGVASLAGDTANRVLMLKAVAMGASLACAA
jgi:hypothetical protein